MKILALALSATLSLGVSTAPPALSEANRDDSESFLNLVSQAAPEILADTVAHEGLEITSSSGSITIDATAPTEIDMAEAESEVLLPPAMTLAFSAGIVRPEMNGVYQVDTADSLSQAFIQTTGFGYRVITTIESKFGPTSFDYELDLPIDAAMEVHDDVIYFVDAHDAVVGVLEIPWAKDSLGKSVDTRYSWSNGTLTQHVELSGDEAFPVIADPAWSYAYNYRTNQLPNRVYDLLRGCFNCYFPVAGAPRAFPSTGQLLPLTVLGRNYECLMQPVTRSPQTGLTFSFVATRNHIHGQGSTIRFTFRNDRRLYVSANINNGAFNYAAYRIGAQETWRVFAGRLERAL